MAKQIVNLQVSIRDTDAPGVPDTVEYGYTVSDTVETDLSKDGHGRIESPDFSLTGTEIYAACVAAAKAAEGIL